jgi:hypothetical protein
MLSKTQTTPGVVWEPPHRANRIPLSTARDWWDLSGRLFGIGKEAKGRGFWDLSGWHKLPFCCPTVLGTLLVGRLN